MTLTTARMGLPLIAAGQAQKELTHNEALLLCDTAIQLTVLSAGLSATPPSPAPGQCWIVGTAAIGAWSGKDGALAAWTEAGWRFIMPKAGFAAYNLATAKSLRFDGSSWVDQAVNANAFQVDGLQVVGARLPAISNPAGGTGPDAESRVAIGAILNCLRTHGLIAP